jgi:fructoselysine-6-P-deglycase FrlB-like protein
MSRIGRQWYVPAILRGIVETKVWRDATGIPDALEATLGECSGVREAARLLGAPDVRRIVATGNGAAYYAAFAFWLAAAASGKGKDVVAVPAGLLGSEGFRWREGDRLLAISSSGELRDVIDAVQDGAPRPYVAVTSTPDSTIAAEATGRINVRVERQDAPTHTQAYCGNTVALLALWAELTGDETLAGAVRHAPNVARASLDGAVDWALDALVGVPDSIAAAVAFGSGPAWSAALETALLLKEVALIPGEGVETREGGTSAMYALAPDHVVVSIPAGHVLDPRIVEVESVCRRRGATVIRCPGTLGIDARLAAIASFPAALALAASLALRSGHDVDRPVWEDAYFETARPTKNEHPMPVSHTP